MYVRMGWVTAAHLAIMASLLRLNILHLRLAFNAVVTEI